MLICPNCKKKFRTNTLVCPDCKRELLPPSAIKLLAEHPDMARAKRSPKPIPSKKAPDEKRGETYMDLLRGSPDEVNEAARFLEKEGIRCRIEQDEAFRFQVRLDGEKQVQVPLGMAVRVPAFQLEKALALLDWENQKDDLPQEKDAALTEDQEELLVCPGCESEIIPEEGACPECGWEFDLEDETDEEEYFCSSCGESCDPDDPVCPNCGAHFDH
ncbi:MAG: zinc ribbon domain-containing protein [Nitrospirae bacterium]|nr:zinc ribbon domain-containing protein [Nitrospirota bacterium]